MKIVCKQQDLAKGLSTVSHAVSSRTTLPILSNVLLSAEGDSVRLSATNLEIGITCAVPATVQQAGTITVPARLLTDFVNSLPTGDVRLEAQGGGGQSIKVSGQHSQATVRGMDAAEFPSIPGGDDSAPAVRLPAAELRRMIREVAFAAATDDARPVFTGVLVRVRDGRLTFAAADSFRLAVRTAAVEADATLADLLVPARTLTELGRILPDEGEVDLIANPARSQMLFRVQGAQVELVTNLIAGQFPNFEVILPKTLATTATLPAEEFRAAARRAAIFGREGSNIVRLKIAPGENGGLMPAAVTLEATAEESGDTTTTIDSATVDGPGVEIIFNVKYLTDVLGVLEGDQVRLGLNSPAHPGVIRRVDADAENYVYVIMPMHNAR